MLEYINMFFDQVLFWICIFLVIVSTVVSIALTAWLFSDDARKRRDIIILLLLAYLIGTFMWYFLYSTFDIVRTT